MWGGLGNKVGRRPGLGLLWGCDKFIFVSDSQLMYVQPEIIPALPISVAVPNTTAHLVTGTKKE